MPYTYSPRIRLTPPAGAQAVTDLSAFTYTIRQEMREGPILTEHELIDYSVEQTRYGWRRQVFLDFHFPTDATSNESSLMEILKRALDDEWAVEISLNSGTTYRACVLSSYDVSDGDGKKAVGRIISTAWTVKARQDEPTAVLGGSW